MRPIYAFLFAAFLMAQSGMAQSTPDQKTAPQGQTATASSNPEDSGPTAFVQAEGNNFNMGTIVTYDFNLGYKFNQHTSVDIGVPLFYHSHVFSHRRCRLSVPDGSWGALHRRSLRHEA